MPGSVIPVTGLLNGPVGAISQTDFPLISPRKVRITDTLPVNFGDPVVLNATNDYSSVAQFVLLSGTLTATTPLGIAKDTVETNAYYPLGGGTNMAAGQYVAGMDANVLTRGTINVAINHGTPPGAGSPLFVRIVLNGAIPLGVVGGFEAVADSTNTVALTNIVFKTGVLSTDPVSGQVTAQVTILERTMA